MDQPRFKSGPRTQFRVLMPERVLNGDQQIIFWLYQPLLGTTAVSVYGLLQDVAKKKLNGMQQCFQILEQLACGWNQLEDAVKHLEAIGLVRTFVKNDSFNDQLFFVVLRPQQPRDFLKDDLLRSLLLETVGEQHYQELVGYFFAAPKATATLGQEITQDFLDVYQLDQTELAHADSLGFDSLPSSSHQRHSVSSNLDFSLLGELLKKSFVDQNQVLKHQRQLETANLIYGLDEIAIVHLLENAANIETNKVDFRLFFQLLHENYQQKKPVQSVQNENKFQKKRVQSIETTQDTMADQLLSACQAYTPADFLQTLKHEEGSFVTNSELNLIEHFGTLGYLDPAVINVLIHYMIVDRGMASLNRAFFEKVAADWKRKKITSAAAAIEQVKQFNQKPLANKKKQSRIKSDRITQKEKLPFWAEKGFKIPEQTTFSTEKRKELEAELKKFKK
jgi:replication initiation and membrane attachment protein